MFKKLSFTYRREAKFKKQLLEYDDRMAELALKKYDLIPNEIIYPENPIAAAALKAVYKEDVFLTASERTKGQIVKTIYFSSQYSSHPSFVLEDGTIMFPVFRDRRDGVVYTSIEKELKNKSNAEWFHGWCRDGDKKLNWFKKLFQYWCLLLLITCSHYTHAQVMSEPQIIFYAHFYNDSLENVKTSLRISMHRDSLLYVYTDSLQRQIKLILKRYDAE